MTRFIGAALALALMAGPFARFSPAGGDSDAILDKAIKALGGEEKLSKIKAATWKAKGKISFGGNDSEFTATGTFDGLDHVRQEFEGDFGGMTVKGVTVLAGNKGWRKFGDMGMELDKENLANEKRMLYLQVVPATIVPLKSKGFKVKAGGEEKVNGKPAVSLKVTGPDGKDFTLAFDKESGLPVKLVAKVLDFMGAEFTQETLYSEYKDFKGLKRAAKIESKRDGERFLEQRITEFRVLDKVEAKAFAEP